MNYLACRPVLFQTIFSTSFYLVIFLKAPSDVADSIIRYIIILEHILYGLLIDERDLRK